MAEESEDRILKMFFGRNIFITGGSGFLGKVLIEKLLRYCPTVGTLYLLMRQKKGKEPHERLAEIFKNPLFEQLINERGLKTIMAQCSVISGDCTLPDLGISKSDRQLLADKISIIYHCAATIRFDEALKTAILLNTRGTKLMLELAENCPNLELYCHVSTSYCHLNEKLLLEKPYPPPVNPHKIIKAMEWLDEEVVNVMQDKILGNIPNSYAFTKSLAEALVVEKMSTLPAIILRPSIVIPIRYDPIPGWTDNINGPTGLLIGAGKGVIRTMYCNSTGYGDYLPVDFAVNGIFVSSLNYIHFKDHKRNIIHLTSSAEIKVSWEEIINIGRWVVCNKLPLNGVMWYPGGSMKSSRLHHNICSILYHWIPAILIDCLLFCIGYKPVLCRVQRKIQKGFDVFEYYANNQWDFDNKGVVHLRSIQNSIEAKRYALQDNDIDMYEYFEHCIRAARIYILKETDDTIPAARRHMTIMFWVDKISKFIILALFLYYVGGFIFRSLFSNSMKSTITVIDSI